MTAPAEDPRGGGCGRQPATCEHGGCAYVGCEYVTRPAAGRGDTDSGGDDLDRYIAEQQRDPEFRAAFAAAQARPNIRRLAWFTDAELAAELTRRALDGA